MRSALVGELFDLALGAATKPIVRSSAKRAKERMEAVLWPKLKEIEDRYADDPEGRVRALANIYATNKMNPAAGCGSQLLPGLLWNVLTSLWSHRGQTVRDRATGTVLVVDP